MAPFEVQGSSPAVELDEASVPPIAAFFPPVTVLKAFFRPELAGMILLNLIVWIAETAIFWEWDWEDAEYFRTIYLLNTTIVMVLFLADAIFMHKALPDLERQVEAVNERAEEEIDAPGQPIGNTSSRSHDSGLAKNVHAKVSKQIDTFLCQGQPLPKITFFINLVNLMLVLSASMAAVCAINFGVVLFKPDVLLYHASMHLVKEGNDQQTTNLSATFTGLPDALQGWANEQLSDDINFISPFTVTMSDGTTLLSRRTLGLLPKKRKKRRDDRNARHLYELDPGMEGIRIHGEYANPRAVVAFQGDNATYVDGRNDEENKTSLCFLYDSLRPQDARDEQKIGDNGRFSIFATDISVACYFAGGSSILDSASNGNLDQVAAISSTDKRPSGRFVNSTTHFGAHSVIITTAGRQLPVFPKFYDDKIWLLYPSVICDQQDSDGLINASVFVTDYPRLELIYKGSTQIGAALPRKYRTDGYLDYLSTSTYQSGGRVQVWIFIRAGFLVFSIGSYWIYKKNKARPVSAIPGCLGLIMTMSYDTSSTMSPTFHLALAWLVHLPFYFVLDTAQICEERDIMLWTSYVSLAFTCIAHDDSPIFIALIMLQGIVLNHMKQVGTIIGTTLMAGGCSAFFYDAKLAVTLILCSFAFVGYIVVGSSIREYRPYVSVYGRRCVRHLKQTSAYQRVTAALSSRQSAGAADEMRESAGVCVGIARNSGEQASLLASTNQASDMRYGNTSNHEV